ncbi:hypothetical protein ASO20_02490 [Mycoplasma sp. (ex Biomphalaria glabrata)]|uniref:dihydrofolate reductase n=1 Tax=Mycoplasma sp. (ex Biomphalaria glabrata) TaxID=1749074 RepID=UPI00073AC807|nr:dihydrofolate reductase [Mycoplasma sp. (ex Biomphalaria glabrata)]ALV23503.1 hypothetical protein ASO20_02490 [Mycoplasma sp. (ex Biomphalaria glabrata)]
MISFILAMDRNGLIGNENKLPWHIPAELKYFRQVTLGKDMLMGRKTFESIGKPLPGRNTIILTNNKDYYFDHPNVRVVFNVDKLLAEYSDKELMVVGGAAIFKLLYEKCETLYLTIVKGEYQGDTYFKDINLNDFILQSEQDNEDFTTYVYKRKS